ncbi:dihydrofolate reductase family protein [Microlunatus parietis]|uniref:Dihydrofolate reductase n=1 Tax=Microlunatus parietis TaxID=682979 RepID=A0A7Y9I6K0_9ACTN|nr:dihydrofolate reductase family protein [Microlunatus parietis]NYE71216.1 dihydrofolate reductase [Microlunatus parietis]
MRKLVYYVGVSLDGYIAGPGQEIDFFPVPQRMLDWIQECYPETLPTHGRQALGFDDAENKAFDTLVMGRGTFEPALAIPSTHPYAHLREYVVSSTLQVDDPSVEVVDDPMPLIRRLKAEDSPLDIWLGGGGKLAASVLPEIDELIIKSYPVVAGAGVPMLAGRFDPTLFRPTRREEVEGSAQVTWYTRV